MWLSSKRLWDSEEKKKKGVDGTHLAGPEHDAASTLYEVHELLLVYSWEKFTQLFIICLGEESMNGFLSQYESLFWWTEKIFIWILWDDMFSIVI